MISCWKGRKGKHLADETQVKKVCDYDFSDTWLFRTLLASQNTGCVAFGFMGACVPVAWTFVEQPQNSEPIR